MNIGSIMMMRPGFVVRRWSHDRSFVDPPLMMAHDCFHVGDRLHQSGQKVPRAAWSPSERPKLRAGSIN